jgi:UDP-N-acetyl-D-glucosamine dehydrogenase
MSPSLTQLKERINSHQAKVGVVGLGYVGLPFAVEKAKVGFPVLGIDLNSDRVAQVNQGTSYIDDVASTELAPLVQADLIQAADNFDACLEMDVIVICVPTPLTENLTPDTSYIEKVTQEIAARLRPGQLITLESTTYPGTTDEIMRPLLEQGGLKQGRDFFLAHSPERVDPGNQRYTTKNTSKVIGASDEASLAVAVQFYQQTIQHVVPVSSAKAAELVKVFENTFRAVNIALVNELSLLCDRMGLNVWEVLDAANTKPFGIMPFYPGPGVGGHCIPLDPHYLEWKAKQYNFNTHFIALAGEINRKMPEFVCEKVVRCLNRLGIALSRAKILLIGVAYKKDLRDCRESPAIEILQRLLREGAEVTYHDPFIPQVEVNRQSLLSSELTSAAIAAADLVLITTDHSHIDYAALIRDAKLVLDTRGVTRHLPNFDEEKVVLL